MSTQIKKTFRNRDIAVDSGTTYVNCHFVNCHFIYTGGDIPFVNPKIEDCQVTITGEAGKVVQFMMMVGMIQPPPQQPPQFPPMADSGQLH